MSNCREGDLAYVLPSARTVDLRGRWVYVRYEFVGEAHEGCSVDPGPEKAWICEAATGGLLPWPTLGGERQDWVKSRPIVDCILRPIRDPEDGVEGEITTKETVCS